MDENRHSEKRQREIRDWLTSDEYGRLWTRFPPPTPGDAIDSLSGEAVDNSPETWNGRYTKTDWINNFIQGLREKVYFAFGRVRAWGDGGGGVKECRNLTNLLSTCQQRNVVVRDFLIIIWSTNLRYSAICHVPAQHALWNLLLLVLIFWIIIEVTGTIISTSILFPVSKNCRASWSQLNKRYD